MIVLAVETSCDDTCAAVTDDARILSNVISSQAEAHARYGGVVPEVASRHHLELVNPVVHAALSEGGVELADVDALAVTTHPGLIGALLVGVATAKGLAAPLRKPLIGVDHLHGHVAANFLEPDPLEPPFLCLIASGGHTLLAGVTAHDGFEILGQTLDDAAGEALDKGARLLGLGYPGGPAIQREAEDGDPEAFEFPVAMTRDPGLDFSFSGLKTALLYAIKDLEEGELARQVAVPSERMQAYELAGRQVFVPVIAFNALYSWSGGKGQTSVSYLLGRDTKGEKMGPFRLDLGPRIFRGVAGRLLPTGVRT